VSSIGHRVLLQCFCAARAVDGRPIFLCWRRAGFPRFAASTGIPGGCRRSACGGQVSNDRGIAGTGADLPLVSLGALGGIPGAIPDIVDAPARAAHGRKAVRLNFGEPFLRFGVDSGNLVGKSRSA